MDDIGSVLCATECASNDSEMTNIQDGVLAEVSLPAESDFPPTQDGGGCDCAGQPQSQEAADVAKPEEMTRRARIVEAILFSSDGPLSAARLADLVEGCTPGQVRKCVTELNEKYEQAGCSFRIESIARGYQMLTLPDYERWVAKLHKQRGESRLSPAAMETLAIVAYKQPIIRADVEAVRGVSSGEVISRLREMGLVRILGRADVVGRPLLYGTTKKFLEVFGLADLDDLPPMEALRRKPVSKPIAEVEPVKPPPSLALAPRVAVVGA